jgi:hypothetical protein
LTEAYWGPDHSASDQRWFEAGFPDGAHDADRVRREAGDVNDIWAGGLDRPHDRTEVDLVRREAAIVNDLEIILLGPMSGADCSRLRKLGIGNRDCHELWLRIHRHRDVEEALREGQMRVRSEGEDLKILVVAKLFVDPQSSKRHEDLVVLHHKRHRRTDDVGAVSGNDEVDFVDVKKLGVDARHQRRIALVVVIDQLHLAAEEAAFGVLIFGPHLGRQQRGLAVAGVGSRESHAETDLDGLRRYRLVESCSQAQHGHRKRQDGPASKSISGELHLFLPFFIFLVFARAPTPARAFSGSAIDAWSYSMGGPVR